MRGRLTLTIAVVALAVGQPAAAEARTVMCENICGDFAARNCSDIDSASCGAYIFGCLAGCGIGKLISWFG